MSSHSRNFIRDRFSHAFAGNELNATGGLYKMTNLMVGDFFCKHVYIVSQTFGQFYQQKMIKMALFNFRTKLPFLAYFLHTLAGI